MSETDLIKECLRNDRRAMRELYHRYAPVMYAICLRYMHRSEDARDVLQEGFIRVFNNLRNFRQEGSFEGWMKRIFIRQAINQYHKHKTESERELAVEVLPDAEQVPTSAIDRMSEKELLQLVASLPPGYRMVFNLYAIEGYSHDEIGGMLKIQAATSRSQLLKARNMLQHKLKKLNHETGERIL